jgi:hypothetical protein
VAASDGQVLIGAPNHRILGGGQAQLFDALSGTLNHTFIDPTPTGNDRFGESVALSDDYVLVGADGHNAGAGAVGEAHLFDRVTGALLHTFSAPTPGTSGFGFSVSIDGTNILIGAQFTDLPGGSAIEQGAGYLYDAVSGDLLQVLTAVSPSAGDFLGYAVAIHGENALLGMPGGGLQGQALVFGASDANAVVAEPSNAIGVVFGLLGFLGWRRLVSQSQPAC